MKYEIMKRWVAALRSGDYKKTTGVLCRRDNNGMATGFCCLGVLTNLYVNEKALPPTKRKELVCGQGSLSTEVKAWAGMSSLDGRGLKRDVPGYKDSLSTLNDDTSLNVSFDTIADVIEKNYDTL